MMLKSHKWLIAGLLLIPAFLCFISFLWVSAHTIVPMAQSGASPTASGWSAFALSLLSACGFSASSIGVAIWAFLSKNAATIQNVVPGFIVPPPKEQKDLTELGAAAAYYVLNMTDVSAQRRLVLAAMTEFSNMPEMQSPEIASATSALGQSVAAKWLPPAGASK